jgi:hypothetical protein
MTEKIVIYHFDDRAKYTTAVDTYVISMNDENKKMKSSFEFKYVPFDSSESLKKCLVSEKKNGKQHADIIILDMYEVVKDGTETTAGCEVLKTLNEINFFIPTILYTRVASEFQPIDYDALYQEYQFISRPFVEKDNKEKLKQQIRKIVSKIHPTPQNFLYNKNDNVLAWCIDQIGHDNLVKIIEHYQLREVKIEKMPLGFSDAVLFKLCTNNDSIVLKVSKNKDKLRKEHELSTTLYKKLPHVLTIATEYLFPNYENEDVLATAQKEVTHNNPLFVWLGHSTKKEIETMFHRLYFSSELCTIYQLTLDKEHEKHDYRVISERITQVEMAELEFVFAELKPILEKYQCANLTIFESFLLSNIYKNISPHSLSEKDLKPLVLSHGDFHSKNILIKNNPLYDVHMPVIIDSGGMGYHYWTKDICKLIVDLFINGFHYNTINYFDPNQIDQDLNTIKTIADVKQVAEDGINDSFISAINWLLGQMEVIYGNLYCKWEFQLGLIIELIQMSRRFNSVPPNKRALAIIACSEILELASNNFSTNISPNN